MEIKREHKVDEIIGDLKTNKFKIGEDSMGIIIDSLINLYSDPIGSIVREVTSNCYDAHKEKKLKITKVIPMEKDDDEKWFHPTSETPQIEFQEENILLGIGNAFLFRDFGVGLSKERVEQIYTLFGNSTKRDNNHQIGGFGIGAKSPFSYTDTFYITTNYNGKKYNYMLYRGNEAFHMDLIKTLDTTELNSTEVVIPINEDKGYSDIRKFGKAIKNQLMYFIDLKFINVEEGTGTKMDPPGIDYEDDLCAITLEVHSDYREVHLMVGRVRYPLNTSMGDIDKLLINESMPMALKFAVGEIDLVPSREAIRYTERTITAIKDKINTVKAQAIKACNEQLKNCSNFVDWLKMGNALTQTSSWRREYDSVFSVRSHFADMSGEDGICNLHDVKLSCSPLHDNVLSEKLFRGFTAYKVKKESNSKYVGGYKLTKSTLKIEDLYRYPIYHQVQTFSEDPNVKKKTFTKPKDFFILTQTPDNAFIQIRQNRIDGAAISKEKELSIYGGDGAIRTEEQIKSDFAAMVTLLSHCKLIDYDNVKIVATEEDEAMGDFETDQERRKRLGEVFTRQLYFDDRNGCPTRVRFGNQEFSIEELGTYKDNGGVVIYGFSKHDQLLKNIGAILNQGGYYKECHYYHSKTTNPEREPVLILKIAASLERQVTEFINVEKLFEMKSEMLKNWYTAQLLADRIEKVNFFQIFKDLNEEMFYLWRNLHRNHKKYYEQFHYLHRQDQKELALMCKESNCIHTKWIQDLETLEKYAEHLHIFEHLGEVESGAEENRIKDKSFFLALREYLRIKNKTVLKFKKIRKKKEISIN